MKIQNMSNMTYYVAEVSFRPTNPIHRCICFHRAHGDVHLWDAGYGEIININTNRLSFFRIISEISDMNREKYPNAFKLPKDITK